MTDHTNRRTRFRSYSLRALMALTALLGVVFAAYVAVYVRPLKRQAVAIDRLRELGGRPQVTTHDRRGVDESNEAASSPVGRMLNINSSIRVPYVDLTHDSVSADAIRLMIPHLLR